MYTAEASIPLPSPVTLMTSDSRDWTKAHWERDGGLKEGERKEEITHCTDSCGDKLWLSRALFLQTFLQPVWSSHSVHLTLHSCSLHSQ